MCDVEELVLLVVVDIQGRKARRSLTCRAVIISTFYSQGAVKKTVIKLSHNVIVSK